MERHRRFGLVLVVTHACNLRCTYCYTGAKTRRVMPEPVARHAVGRALRSLVPGGRLDLGFFGGEPLLEPRLVADVMAHARERAACDGVTVRFQVTTNGTVAGDRAWSILTDPDMEPAVSVDGLPAVHDRHRVDAGGCGTSARVEATVVRLVGAGKAFRAVAVVRPDSLDQLAEGVRRLFALGVPSVELSLDLWTTWTEADASRLEGAVAELGALWRERLPASGLSWFDEALGRRSRLAGEPTRCGFGVGDIAVAPSGNLYPCERLIGEDHPSNPWRLPGHALSGEDFLAARRATPRGDPACAGCALRASCGTTCRCSNLVRTGDPFRPDGLLCLLERLCSREVLAAGRVRADIVEGTCSARSVAV